MITPTIKEAVEVYPKFDSQKMIARAAMIYNMLMFQIKEILNQNLRTKIVTSMPKEEEKAMKMDTTLPKLQPNLHVDFVKKIFLSYVPLSNTWHYPISDTYGMQKQRLPKMVLRVRPILLRMKILMLCLKLALTSAIRATSIVLNLEMSILYI